MRNHKVLLFIGLIFGLLLPNAKAEQSSFAELRLTVLKNGQPLPNWPIRFSLSNNTIPSPITNYTLTGPDGSITLHHVRAGSGRVSVNVPWPTVSTNSVVSQAVQVQPNTLNTAAVELHTGRVAGTVKLLSIPIPGARLILNPLKPVPNGRAGPTPLFQNADSRGRFDFDAPVGDYKASLTYGDANTTLWTGTVIVNEGETSALNIAPTVQNPSILFGRVQRDGHPLPELYVSVLKSGDTVYPMTRVMTGGSGQFLVPLPPGTYDVSVSDYPVTSDPYNGSTATVYQTQSVKLAPNSRVFLDASLTDGYLEGTITKYGQPLVGAKVRLVGNRGYPNPNSSTLNTSEALTDSSGHYRVRLIYPLPAVTFFSPGGEAIHEFTGTQVPSRKPLNFDWKPQHINAIVKTRSGEPVADFPIGAGPNAIGTRTASDGSFTLEVDYANSAAAHFLYGGGLNWTIAEPKYLGDNKYGDPTEVVLESQPGRIEGRVLSAGPDKNTSGSPLPGVRVLLSAAGGGLNFNGGETVTDADGRYVFEKVPSHSLFVTPGVNAANSGKVVTVKPGATTTADFTLTVANLSARVQVGKKSVVPAYLLARKLGTSDPLLKITPNESGEFTALLTPGTYAIEYAPGPEVVVPGIAPQLASRIVQTVDIQAGQTASLLLRVNRLDPLWTFDLGSNTEFHAGAVTLDHVAYLGSDDGTVMAIRAEPLGQPELLWKTSLFSPIRAKPLLVGTRLFIAASDGRLHAFDVPGGRIPSGEASGFPISLGARFDLNPVWSSGATASGGVSDSLKGDVLLTANSPQPAIYRVNGSTGTLVKTLALPAPAVAEPLAANGLLIAPLSDNRTVAFNSDGTMAWERDHPASRAVLGPVVMGPHGRLLQGSDSGTLEGLMRESGDSPTRWPTTPLFSANVPNRFDGIRDATVASTNGEMLFTPAGTLGLLSFLSGSGQICKPWPWTTQDPYGMGTTIPYRYLASPTDWVTTGGAEYLYSTAILESSSLGESSLVLGPSGLPGGSSYGVFLHLPLAHPGNDYSVFYGDVTDPFVGQPAVTGSTPDDLVLVPTSNGRLYAFPVIPEFQR